MQNIKNFRLTEPTQIQKEQYAAAGVMPYFLQSEDGQDWYECQALFADDTVKIMYDDNGIIRSIVDAPVPERGDTYAVSLFYPLNMSVAEVDINDIPDGLDTSGKWVFADGVIAPRTYTPDELEQQVARKKADLLHEADDTIRLLERAVKHGMATPEEAERLEAWERYSVLLSRVNPGDDWPTKPGQEAKHPVATSAKRAVKAARR